MGLQTAEDSDWLIVHEGERKTRVYWCGHDVSKWVTSVAFEHNAQSGNPIVQIGVYAKLRIECAAKAPEADAVLP